MSIDAILTQLLMGLTVGVNLVLVATGLTLVFGMMGVINFAHSALFMLGAYVGLVATTRLGSFWLAPDRRPLRQAAHVLARARLRPARVCAGAARRRIPFGRALVAVRKSEERARAIGIDVTRHRRVALVFSGALVGLAGALFAIFQNFVSPELLFFALSGEVVVIALLGGLGTLYGSLVGAVIAIGLREILSTYTDNWLVFLGAPCASCASRRG